MIVPLALLTDEGQVELLVQGRHGDIEAIDSFLQAIGIGDLILGVLQQHSSLLLRILGQAGIQVQDGRGSQTHVNGHLPILDGQGALPVHGLIGVEHGAVGVEVRQINAVLQRRGSLRGSFCGFSFRGFRSLGHHGGSFRRGGLGRSGLGAGRQTGGQSRHSQDHSNLFFHVFITSQYLS